MSYNEFGEITRERGIGLFSFPDNYIVIDIETTGLSPSNCDIIELSAIKVRNKKVVDTFSSLVRPELEIPDMITDLTGITNAMVESSPVICEILPSYLDFLGSDVLVGHNVCFDISFIRNKCNKFLQCDIHNDYIDTLRISKKIIHDIDNYKLASLAKYFNIIQNDEHRGLADCETTNEIFMQLKNLNLEKDKKFEEQFKDIEGILSGKQVVFKGTLSLCAFETYESICKRAGGTASKIFYQNADYIVFGKSTFAKFKRGDYSAKMLKALDLSKNNSLKILSEYDFAKMFGVCIYDGQTSKNKINIKELSTEITDFDETHPLFGKTCVFTGVLDKMQRKVAMQKVLDFGGKISGTVTKKTNYLILGCNDFCKAITDGKSAKHKKAEEYMVRGYDIEIIDEDVFYDMLEQ